MDYRTCYEEGSKILREANVQEANLDARLLLEFVCGTDYGYLFAHGTSKVPEEQVSKYKKLIAKRASRYPLQYITGEQEFMGLTFRVNENVLIPRQDTEILVEKVWKTLKPGMFILDMCTGSGCILISLLHQLPSCTGMGVDISKEALEVAKENGRRILTEAPGRVQWIHSDLFERVRGNFDVIVSNPPYIPTAEVEELMPEVRIHEPHGALDGMTDGLYFYRKIAIGAQECLKTGGALFLEIGYQQAAEVATLLVENGFSQIELLQDYAGLDRVVCARKEGWTL